MSSVSIKINIAGRTYPLTIEEGEERAVLNAAELINASIKNLQENYAVKDLQDLLAMSALQLLVEHANAAAPVNAIDEKSENQFHKEMETIDTLLTNLIQS